MCGCYKKDSLKIVRERTEGSIGQCSREVARCVRYDTPLVLLFFLINLFVSASDWWDPTYYVERGKVTKAALFLHHFE